MIAFRVLFALLAFAFLSGGVLAIVRFYEIRTSSIPDRFKPTLAGELGGWARESMLQLASWSCWIPGVLPRGKLKAGAWMPTPEEKRPGLPVLLLPGYAMSRVSLRMLANRLEATGRPALAVDLPHFKPLSRMAEVIAEAAMELKRATQSEQIDVVAHSRAGLAARWWIQKAGGDAHVDRCVTLGTPHKGTKVAAFGAGAMAETFPNGAAIAALAAEPLPDRVRFFAINAAYEQFVLPPGNDELPEPGVNVRVAGVGHLGLLASHEVWMRVHAALRRASDEGIVEGFDVNETTDEAAMRVLAKIQR